MSLILIVIAAVAYAWFLRARITRHRFPDGPKGRFIVGNIREVTSAYQWKRFSQMSRAFGDIIYLNVLRQPIVILNNLSDALDLMDKNSAIYSDRPRMVYIYDLLKIRSVSFMPYGPIWRASRRLIHQHLNSRSVDAYRDHQMHCVLRLLDDLLGPGDSWGKITKYTTSLILLVTYGHQVSSDEDELVTLNAHADEVIFGPAPPGATILDIFPALRYMPSFMPGGELKRIALENRTSLWKAASRPYEMVKEKWMAGTAMPCLLTRMLDDYEQKKQYDMSQQRIIKDVCASMYRAGVGTIKTSATIYVFILAMLLHPHVARKAQIEIDRVLEHKHLPTFEDKDKLPYITCILKECLRWRPPVPLGVAHRSTKEGQLRGRYISNRSIIIPNVWHMMHEERYYSNPDAFDPDRFLGENPAMDPNIAVFGFGRRICPGRYFAEASVWLVMANILSAFNVSPELDENGQEVIPNGEFTPTLVSSPVRFPYRLIPRSPEVISLVKSSQSSEEYVVA